MNNDFKSLDELIQKYNYNYKNKPLVEELEKIKYTWEKQKLYIDNEIEWDELHDAELNFNNLKPGTLLIANSWMQHQLTPNTSRDQTRSLHFIISHRERACNMY